MFFLCRADAFALTQSELDLGGRVAVTFGLDGGGRRFRDGVIAGDHGRDEAARSHAADEGQKKGEVAQRVHVDHPLRRAMA